MLSGVLRDCDTEEPIPNATIELYKCDYPGIISNVSPCEEFIKSTTTDEDGFYNMTAPGGAQRLRAVADGYFIAGFPFREIIDYDDDDNFTSDIYIIPKGWIEIQYSFVVQQQISGTLSPLHEDCTPQWNTRTFYNSDDVKIYEVFGGSNVEIEWNCAVVWEGCFRDTIHITRNDTTVYVINL